VTEVVLRADQGEAARAPVVGGKAQLTLPDRPGLYAVTCAASREPLKVLSVNPSPKESDLTYLHDPQTLQVWQLEPGTTPAREVPSVAFAQLPLSAIRQQEIWWWLLLGGLTALLLETLWVLTQPRRP
jgi:hypothetical protein